MGRKWGTFLQSHRYLPPQAVKHRNMEWIKTIDKNGLVKNINWSEKYNILRRYLNSSYPEGYVWHEAVVWNPSMSHYLSDFLPTSDICKWFILPRKVSQNTPYDPVSDEVMGSNVMIIASDDWQSEEDLELRHVGPLEPEWGYTSVKVIPGMVKSPNPKLTAFQTPTI